MIAARGTINKIVNRAMPAKVIWRSCQSKPRFRDRKRTIANYTGQHSRASQAMHVPKWRGHRELHHAHEPTHSRFGRDSVRFTVAANQERLSGSNDQPPTPRRSKPSNNRRSSVVGRRSSSSGEAAPYECDCRRVNVTSQNPRQLQTQKSMHQSADRHASVEPADRAN